MLDELKALESGIVGDSLLGVLREVRTCDEKYYSVHVYWRM